MLKLSSRSQHCCASETCDKGDPEGLAADVCLSATLRPILLPTWDIVVTGTMTVIVSV